MKKPPSKPSPSAIAKAASPTERENGERFVPGDPLWDLLGKGAAHNASEDFADRVLNAVALDARTGAACSGSRVAAKTRAVRAWFAQAAESMVSRAWGLPGAAVAAALVLSAVFFLSQRDGTRPSDVAVARTDSSTELQSTSGSRLESAQIASTLDIADEDEFDLIMNLDILLASEETDTWLETNSAAVF